MKDLRHNQCTLLVCSQDRAVCRFREPTIEQFVMTLLKSQIFSLCFFQKTLQVCARVALRMRNAKMRVVFLFGSFKSLVLLLKINSKQIGWNAL